MLSSPEMELVKTLILLECGRRVPFRPRLPATLLVSDLPRTAATTTFVLTCIGQKVRKQRLEESIGMRYVYIYDGQPTEKNIEPSEAFLVPEGIGVIV